MIFNPLAFCEAKFIEQRSTGAACKLGAQGECSLLIVQQDAVVSSGELSFPMAAGGFALGTHSFLLLPKGEGPYTLLALRGSAALAFAAELPRLWAGDGKRHPAVALALRRLVHQIDSAEAYQNSILAYGLVCALHEAMEQGASAQPLPLLVSCAIDSMQQNYAGVYGVEELAEELGVSKSHLVRGFSSAMGVSPGRYLTNVRIDASKQLLLHRKYSLQIIATLCGFSSAHYFCKVFKKTVGLSPTEWRQEAAGSDAQLPRRSASQQEDLFYL